MYLELVPQTVMTLEHVVLLIMTVALGPNSRSVIAFHAAE